MATPTKRASKDGRQGYEGVGQGTAYLKYQCRHKPGLRFSSAQGCLARRARAEEHPNYIELADCKDCMGPLPVISTGASILTGKEEENRTTKTAPVEPEMCKCGRAPVVIRKNGTSAGRCKLCMADTVRSWSKGKKKTNAKKESGGLDQSDLLVLLRERKDETESALNHLIEKGMTNGQDRDVFQTIVSLIKLITTIDVVLKMDNLTGSGEAS